MLGNPPPNEFLARVCKLLTSATIEDRLEECKIRKESKQQSVAPVTFSVKEDVCVALR